MTEEEFLERLEGALMRAFGSESPWWAEEYAEIAAYEVMALLGDFERETGAPVKVSGWGYGK